VKANKPVYLEFRLFMPDGRVQAVEPVFNCNSDSYDFQLAKDMVADGICELMSYESPSSILYYHECWVLKDVSKQDQERLTHKGISKETNRTEAVLIYYETPEVISCVMADIINKPRRMLGPLEEVPVGEGSRFAHFFRKASEWELYKTGRNN
jgi:hypothetical protein